MLACNDVGVTGPTLLTVIPVPENCTIAPGAKPWPVIVMFRFCAPWPADAGETPLTIGATMKHEVHVVEPSVEFDAVTSRIPASASGSIDTLAVISEGDTYVVELTVMPLPE